jgi:hypothetical protein
MRQIASIPLHRSKWDAQSSSGVTQALEITQVQPMHLLLMPNLERIMQPSRIYFAVHWAHPDCFFLVLLCTVHTVLNHPLFTILGNGVKRTKLYAITAGLAVINAYLYSDFCVFDLPETQ